MISLGSTATNKTMRKNEQKGYIESGDSCMAEQQPSNHLTLSCSNIPYGFLIIVIIKKNASCRWRQGHPGMVKKEECVPPRGAHED